MWSPVILLQEPALLTSPKHLVVCVTGAESKAHLLLRGTIVNRTKH